MIFTIYFWKEIWKKHTIYRLLFQRELKRRKYLFSNKDVLDLGSGGEPSYGRFVYPVTKRIVKTDYRLKQGVDQVVDFNKKFPFENSMFDVVILCNALYISPDPKSVISEVYRVLRPGGVFVLVSPFVANEMPEPHDFNRWTSEGLRQLMGKSFIERELVSIGERGSVAVYAIQPFLPIFPLRFIFYIVGLLVDSIVPRRVKRNHPFPLGYLYVGEK